MTPSLLAQFSIFSSDPLEHQYQVLKTSFLFLLQRTKQRCEKYCRYLRDQERYASVNDDDIPGLKDRKYMIISSERKVLDEIDLIDKKSDVAERIQELKGYATGLTQSSFNGIFMVIFSGQLRKRWVLFATEQSDENTVVSASYSS